MVTGILKKLRKSLFFSTYSLEGKSVQPYYNQEAKWLIKSQIHKICNIKDLENLQQRVNVLNILFPQPMFTW